ncbi:MAG: ferredoxin--NADP reductase [Pseudomonadota bacterium]
MPPQNYNATVLERTDLAPGLMILRVALDDPNFRFAPGQYTVLGLKVKEPRLPEAEGEELTEPEKADPERIIQRAYSIASSSRPGEYLEFYLTMVSSGTLTPRLFELKKNSRVYVGAKATGHFTLDRVPDGFHVLLVGTGTGLAPYMSMIRSNAISKQPRNYVVLHGARYSWDLGYRQELTSLAHKCGNFHYIPSISRPRDDHSWAGAIGYLQDVLFSGIIEIETGIELTPKNFHVFLCGNPAMIEAAKTRLVEHGFTPDKGKTIGDLHTEEYW